VKTELAEREGEDKVAAGGARLGSGSRVPPGEKRDGERGDEGGVISSRLWMALAGSVSVVVVAGTNGLSASLPAA